jgi:hypothetical protein
MKVFVLEKRKEEQPNGNEGTGLASGETSAQQMWRHVWMWRDNVRVYVCEL